MSNTYFKAMSVMGCGIGDINRRSLCHHNCCDGENCVTWLEKQFAKLNEYEEAKADGRVVAQAEPVCHTLIGVMHSVDKWLDDDELKQDEVNRAATMREKVLKIIERLQAENSTLKKALELACKSIAGEMPYGEANGYYEYYIKKAKEESENG